jgi:hypothetical protein
MSSPLIITMASRLQKSNIITRLTLIAIATVSQPLLPVLLLDLHIYPVSVFCFLASMSTGGRPHATRQPRGREGSTKTHFTCSGNGGCYFLAAGKRKIQPSDGVFLDLLHANGEVHGAASCLSGSITGWLGFTKKKSGSRTEGFRSLGLVRVRRNTVVRKMDESRACFFLAAGQLESGGRRLSTNKSASSSSPSSGKEILSPKRLKAEAEVVVVERNKFFSHHHKPPLRFSPLHMFSLIIVFDLDLTSPWKRNVLKIGSKSKKLKCARARARHVSTRLTVSCLPAFFPTSVLTFSIKILI